MQYLNFIQDPANDFVGHTIEFIKLCGVSILAAIIIGVVLGVLVSRNPIAAFIAVNLSGLVRAIPIIAVLLLFVIILPSSINLGFVPSIIALILLGIPPILLNTYTGIRQIDPATIDAAKGMGMTTWQIVTRIQAPLVTPLVAAGIRTSAVQVVATASLAAYVGAGGYGDYILDALNVGNNTELIVGAASVAILAIIIELLMGWLQRAVTPEGLKVQEQVAAVNV
jgi:osmoprotectant transport system permease protein